MIKVVLLALGLSLFLYASRWVRPRRWRVPWQALRGTIWGVWCSASLALILCALTPNLAGKPFHLSIYLLALNFLFTPAMATFWAVRALQTPTPPTAQEKATFQGMLEKITQAPEAE